MADQNNTEDPVSILTKIKEKSDDDYEKNVTYISAGTLVLSLTFIEKIVTLNRSTAIWALITSWVILVITLLINLVSHQLSSFFHEKTINDFQQSDPKINEKVNNRNKILRFLNGGTTITLISGISFLILYCSLNVKKMTNDKKSLNEPNRSSHINKKGRTITAPLITGSNTKPTATTGSNTNLEQSDSTNQSSTNSNSTSKPN